jgi:hypothetical protein
VGCSLCTCKCVKERRMKEIHVLARLAGPGHVNSPSKSGSKPRRYTTSFYHLFLLRVHIQYVFGKRSSRLFDCFFKFFIMTRLPLHRTRVEGRHLQRELRQANRRFYPIVIVKEPQVTYGFSSQIMSYLLHMLIYLCIMLLNNRL